MCVPMATCTCGLEAGGGALEWPDPQADNSRVKLQRTIMVSVFLIVIPSM